MTADATAALDRRAAGARRFEGRSAIVTAAGQGIGRATARRLAAEGAEVVVADIVDSSAKRVEQELRATGVRAHAFVGDLTRQETASDLAAFAMAQFGRIDVLAAIVGGTTWSKPFGQFSPDEIVHEIDKSLWSCVWCCYAVVPHMMAARSGAIVTLGSHSIVSTDRVPYATAKGGVIALTRSLSKEVAAHGVRINCVVPHATAADDRVVRRNSALTADDTAAQQQRAEERRAREIPMGRRALAEEQAAAIAFMASADASYITGQVLPVGGGATFA